jgi:long-subunit fatty acid transport protein
MNRWEIKKETTIMRRSTGVGLGILLLIGSSLNAQNTDIEALSGLKFNFGNPGARSLGMGGAFLGLADDASAAEANPAGLTILRKREVSVEMRSTTTSQSFATGGTYPFINEKDFPSRQKAVTFASAVFPFSHAVIALYYHQPLQFRNSVDVFSQYSTPIFFLGPDGPVSPDQCPQVAGCQQHQIYPYSAAADVQLSTYGGAIGWERGQFSIGAAVRYHLFRERADTYRVDLDAVGSPTFVVAQTHGSRIFGRNADSDFTYVVGLKWAPSSRFSAGTVYKKGPTFPAPVSAGPQAQGAQPDLKLVEVTDFHVPDSLGLGISFRPLPNLTINADAIRVAYSNLTDRFVSVIEYNTADSGGIERLSGYESHDGTETHLGVEYFILGNTPVAIRAGWWRDPAHSIHYGAPLLTAHDVAAAILFPDRRAEHHYSVGLGLAFPRFQIDAAYDTSETLKQASVSVMARY